MTEQGTEQGKEFRVNGARLIGDMSGAVYWPATGALIVADLHLEKASAYATRGVALPPYDTAETLNRLEACLERFAPRLLVSLGDSFHDIGWQERMAEPDAARLVRRGWPAHASAEGLHEAVRALREALEGRRRGGKAEGAAARLDLGAEMCMQNFVDSVILAMSA